MIYKTGHKDFPSLATYTEMLHSEGANSVNAAAYAARFLSDESFTEGAKFVKAAFEAKELTKEAKKE